MSKAAANEAFVRQYQADNGLRVDGWAGEEVLSHYASSKGAVVNPAFNATPFFNNIRSQLFGGSLTMPQVSGINADLDGCKGLPLSYVAYILATDYHETGKTMQPVTENLNYSVDALIKAYVPRRMTSVQAAQYGRAGSRPANQEKIANIIYGGAWGNDNLGNTRDGDGWRYRGRGKAQITGRRNYRAFGIEETPDAALNLEKAVSILVEGSVRGIFTGKKLGDYLPNYGAAGRDHFIAARRVINGTDKADQIAGYAMAFQSALQAGGWK